MFNRSNAMPIVFAATLLLAGVAGAAPKDQLSRVPGDANLLLIAQVESLLKSPLAAKEGWVRKRDDLSDNRPLLVKPGTKTLVQAALVDLVYMFPIWQVSVMEMSKDTPLKELSMAEGGFTDDFSGIPAMRSTMDAYYVQLGQQVLGAVTPANRQFVARWVGRKQSVGGFSLSEQLTKAATAIDSGADLVLALDLTDAVSKEGAYRRMQGEEFKALGYQDKLSGKTGTAQVGSDTIDIENTSWFVCYAPSDHPEIAVVVCVPYGYSGSSSVSAVEQIFTYYFNKQSSAAPETLVRSNEIAP
jgi:hypothetical protein